VSENSSIQWTTHTFNPWWGCQKVHAGCANCYAEALDHRWGGDHWGADATRRMVLGEWGKPEKWNREAQAAGQRRSVFCASMADLFESYPGTIAVVDQQGAPIKATAQLAKRYEHLLMPGDLWNIPALRWRVFEIIEATPWLDWLLLTKRPQNVERMAPGRWLNKWPHNVWIGTSPCDQKTANESVPALLRLPTSQRFVSMEPLLGPIDFTKIPDEWDRPSGHGAQSLLADIGWGIVGVESRGKLPGRNAREYGVHAGAIIEAFQREGVPIFHKQMPIAGKVSGELSEFPLHLQVREFPVFGGVA
jgi:protein gp37